MGPGGRPRRVLGPPLWRHICADNTGSCTRIDHRPRGDGGCHSANWYDAPISKFSLRNSSRVRLNRGRYRPRRQGHRARTGNVAVTPWEENVTRRRSTGDLGRTRGVEGDGEATRPRRFPPRGAPWTGLPPGPVISIVFSFGYGIHKSLNSSTCGGHLSLHVYQYKIYLENTGTNQFRN